MRMNTLIRFVQILIILWLNLCFCYLGWAKDYEIQSEHFYVIFDAEQADYAKKVLAYSESVYQILSEKLRFESDEQIYVILKSQAEAERIDWIPEEAFFVYIDKELSDVNIHRQIAHGMALTLTLNTSEYSEPFQYLLEDIAFNNQYAPFWYLLGLADYYATPNNPGALARSPEYKAKLTAILKSNPDLRLGDLAAGIQGKPDIELNEIVGLGIVQYVAEHWGADSLAEWNHKHSMSVIPFVYQRIALDVFDKDWNQIFQEWRDDALSHIEQNAKYTASEFIYYKAKLSGDEQEIDIDEADISRYLVAAQEDDDNDHDENEEFDVYMPSESIIPDEYDPFLGYDDDTGVVIGLTFFGEDVLNHHIYQSYIQYMTEKNHVDVMFGYEWNQYVWSLKAEVALEQRTISWEIDDKLHTLDYMTHYADLGTKRTWEWNELTLALSLGYRAEFSNSLHENKWKSEILDESPRWLPQLGWTSSVYAGITFQYSSDTARTMLDEAGYLVHVDAHLETPFLGGSDYTFISNFRLLGAWVMPYLDRHAIVVDIHGGYSNSENRLRFPFELESDHQFSFNNDVSLHGYPTGSIYGKCYALINLKYSANIMDFQAGFDRFPFGVNRFGMAVYGDSAFVVAPDPKNWIGLNTHVEQKYASGVELYLDMMLGWNNPIRFTAGFAYAFSDGGDLQYYIMLSL